MKSIGTIERRYLPVEAEITGMSLPVRGEIPKQLRGTFMRNGPNPRLGGSSHPFFGDGMLHAVSLEGGRATSYANRWVRTPVFESGAKRIGPDGTLDLHVSTANTNVVAHGGRILALMEVAFPYEVRRDLSTVGAYDFAGRLKTAMTAHPKICPLTGEMHFFGYESMPTYPALTYHRASAAGELVESRTIEIPGRPMMHDFAITQRHVIFLDLPVIFDYERAKTGTMPYTWSDTYGARFGIMSRGGDAAVRWFDVEPCYVFHILNAYEDGDTIVVEGARYPELWRDNADSFGAATLYRWSINLMSGSVQETPLDDRPIEFPRVNDSHVGLPYRFGYAVQFDDAGGSTIVKYDRISGISTHCDLGKGRTPGEPVFIQDASSRDEDRGWLATYVYDEERDTSDFILLDARDLIVVATIGLPQRVPFGFHGSWINEIF